MVAAKAALLSHGRPCENCAPAHHNHCLNSVRQDTEPEPEPGAEPTYSTNYTDFSADASPDQLSASGSQQNLFENSFGSLGEFSEKNDNNDDNGNDDEHSGTSSGAGGRPSETSLRGRACAGEDVRSSSVILGELPPYTAASDATYSRCLPAESAKISY